MPTPSPIKMPSVGPAEGMVTACERSPVVIRPETSAAIAMTRGTSMASSDPNAMNSTIAAATTPTAALMPATAARDATAARLAEADLDAVPVTEGIARLARVVAAGGSKYAALVSQFGPANASREQEQITTMIDGLLRRGIDDGTFRDDISASELRFLLGSLLQAAARLAAEQQAGVEKTAALITKVFLHGTGNREDPSEQDQAVRHRTGTRPEQNNNTEDSRSRNGTGELQGGA
jgi:hypothetical protein